MDGQYDSVWIEKLRILKKEQIDDIKTFVEKISKLDSQNSKLRKALMLGIENVERDIASGNFVGDDEHEFLRLAKIALKEGYQQ